MILSNEELKKIYTGTYQFEETTDGYLKANQYSKPQMEYFKGAFEMWYERCDASSAKTIFCEKIKGIVEKYDQIKVVEGYKLVPHLSEYYLDNLHPNQLGAELYGRNLVCEINKLGF